MLKILKFLNPHGSFSDHGSGTYTCIHVSALYGGEYVNDSACDITNGHNLPKMHLREMQTLLISVLIESRVSLPNHIFQSICGNKTKTLNM